MAFDPNDDTRPLRVMVFPDRSDVILIYVPEGQRFWVPPMSTPFVREEVAAAFRDRDIEARVVESTLGRFRESIHAANEADRAERGQRERERQAQKIIQIRHSPTATTVELKRADAIEKKNAIDAEIRKLKLEVATAKSRAHATGVYMSALEFRGKEAKIAALQTDSIALQTHLGTLRKQLAAQNVATSNTKNITDQERFVEVARRMLSKDLYLKIWAEAKADPYAQEQA
jgi:hypothetical protein